MSNRNDSAAALAFLTGAAFGAIAALLLTPKTGKEMRASLGMATDEALDKVKEQVREARFKLAKKTPEDAFRYEGGDCWV